MQSVTNLISSTPLLHLFWRIVFDTIIIIMIIIIIIIIKIIIIYFSKIKSSANLFKKFSIHIKYR